ncbi:Flp family type IVb pilin [Tessaracoccus sp. Y1736]
MVALYAHLTALLHVVGNRFADKTKGATAVEYGIMVALIAVVIIAAVAAIGTQLDVKFTEVLTKIGGAKAP